MKLSSSFSKKKLLLLGFLFAVLLIIPLTVYLVQQKQDTQSHADKNTRLSFEPPTKTAAVGEDVPLGILLSPGNNLVNFVKLAIKFDPTKLTTTEANFVPDPASNLTILEGPVITNGVMIVALTIGNDTTKVIRNDTKIGTITFKAAAGSDPATQVSFDASQVEVRSVNGDNNDAYTDNVFLSGDPASITITGGLQTADVSPSPGAASLSLTPTPTGTSGQIKTTSGNDAPTCKLTLDVSPTGVAPYTISFTAKGTDSDGTISKVTFDFDDGDPVDVTTGGGIGTASVNITRSHTYTTAGNYTTSAVFTDDQDDTSNSVDCASSITISSATGGTNTNTASPTPTIPADVTATPTLADDGSTISPSPLPATGPAQKVMGFGVLGGLLFLIGSLLFLAL